jgi:hypothetical protein
VGREEQKTRTRIPTTQEVRRKKLSKNSMTQVLMRRTPSSSLEFLPALQAVLGLPSLLSKQSMSLQAILANVGSYPIP